MYMYIYNNNSEKIAKNIVKKVQISAKNLYILIPQFSP